MSLVEQLRGIVATMPPGSSVSLPIDWLRQELERSGNSGPTGNGEVEVDYSVQKVAELWGRRPGTVRDWIRSGRLEGYLFNQKEYRVPRAALERFLEEQRSGSSKTRQTSVPARPAALSAWREVMTRSAGQRS
jgi:excisionase family DNA binding protein